MSEKKIINRKSFFGSLLVLGLGAYFMKLIPFNILGSKSSKSKIVIKENSLSVKRNSEGVKNGRA